MTAAASTGPRRRRAIQARLALGMTALALATAALVAVGGFLAAARLAPSPEPRVETQVEQVGDRVLLVRVEGDVAGAAAAEEARRQALRWVLTAAAVAFVPAAGLAWLVAGRLLRPVQRLTDVVEKVDRPDSVERSGLDQPDELGALADGLDRMLDRLDAQRQEQQQLLHEVIHELRTPLAVATTNLELAASSPGLDQDSAAQIGAAQRAIGRMGRTVDDLANHGRLALGAVGDTHVDLAVEGAALVTEHQGPARQRGIHLDVIGPPSVVTPADGASVHVAAGNLLSNALRLAPTGSVVSLTWGCHGDWAWLAVHDEGPGIAPDDQARVFDRYWRGRYDRAREAGSPTTGRDERSAGHRQARGIGLTIARQVIEAQGGRLTLASHEGLGSTFAIWLPMTTDADVADVVPADGELARLTGRPVGAQGVTTPA